MSQRIYLSPPHMGADERALLLEAFDSNWIAPLGPHVDAFEREVAARVGVGHAAALSSGTAAIHLALRILGVSRGDEVITSSLTFSATANPVVYEGATPVFVDSSRETWNMNPALLEEELAASARRGKLPKAVIAVDLYGQCANYERIVALCAGDASWLSENPAQATLAPGESWVVCNSAVPNTLPAASCDNTDTVYMNGDEFVAAVFEGTATSA